jgi:proteasome lid subunit RPN8/RPN11
MLKIVQPVYEEIRSHGERTYPYECCGVLLGDAVDGFRIVRKSIACVNARIDSLENRYSIATRDLIRIQSASREEGMEILGFYHSHPDHPAWWSATDLAEAYWFGYSYVITSIEKGEPAATNSFLLTGDGEESKSFLPESIETVPA